MDELDLLRKKTGMTIGKAFTVVFTLVFITFAISVFFGILFGENKSEAVKLVEDNVFILLLIIFLLGNIWAYFINKKELPFFRKTPISIILISIVVALAYAYISPAIIDIYPFSNKEKETLENISVTNILTLLISIFFTSLQIGFIGHGLLKNYQFKQAIFTVAAVSIMFFVPQAVIGLMFQSMIMFYIYYRTASFQLPIIITIIFSLVEDFLKFIYGYDISKENYIRTYLVQDNTLYFAGLVACVCVIFGGLYYIKKQTKTIEWQSSEEGFVL